MDSHLFPIPRGPFTYHNSFTFSQLHITRGRKVRVAVLV